MTLKPPVLEKSRAVNGFHACQTNLAVNPSVIFLLRFASRI